MRWAFMLGQRVRTWEGEPGCPSSGWRHGTVAELLDHGATVFFPGTVNKPTVTYTVPYSCLEKQERR